MHVVLRRYHPVCDAVPLGLASSAPRSVRRMDFSRRHQKRLAGANQSLSRDSCFATTRSLPIDALTVDILQWERVTGCSGLTVTFMGNTYNMFVVLLNASSTCRHTEGTCVSFENYLTLQGVCVFVLFPVRWPHEGLHHIKRSFGAVILSSSQKRWYSRFMCMQMENALLSRVLAVHTTSCAMKVHVRLRYI